MNRFGIIGMVISGGVAIAVAPATLTVGTVLGSGIVVAGLIAAVTCNEDDDEKEE